MKKMNAKIFLYGTLWVITYLFCLLAVKKLSPTTTVAIALSLIPVLTFSFFIYHFIKKIRFMDEVERSIQLEATVWGFSLGLVMLMTLGALDLVFVFNKKNWGYLSLIPYFVLFYFIGLFISRRKYL
jgi:hypothetical protein